MGFLFAIVIIIIIMAEFKTEHPRPQIARELVALPLVFR
jgi:hypothetical protein